MKQKNTILIIGIMLAVLLTISFASAEFWACFDKGQKAEYCNDYKPDKTCESNNGCQWCMSVYREAENCYVHGSWPKCVQITQVCSLTNGNTSVDAEPPEFELLSPLDKDVFTSRKVLVEFSLDEKADVYYLDLIDGRGRWTRICTDCFPGDPAYSKERSFSEGENNLVFKATDVVGNSVEVPVNFTIDSKDPKIKRTFPKKGFANGDFEVEFQEDNPKALSLFYGNSIQEKQLDIETDCVLDRKTYYCSTNVNLGAYDGGEIEYWFELEDIAGNTDESKHIVLDVDITPPVVNNPDSFFDYTPLGKYVYFNISITEKNFDEVVYTYIDNMGKLKEKRLCSRLKDNLCEKKQSFKKGEHNLTVIVRDEAGNSIGLPANFIIDY